MNRHVIISGGGTGIGRATALRFAQDGDRTVLVGRRAGKLREVADEIAATGAPTPLTVTADLADPTSAAAAAATVAEECSHVDVVVAAAGGNAALSDEAGELDGLAATAWHWEENFRLNTMTAVLLVEALRPHLARGARVLLVSSIAAYRGSGSGSYGASKAGLHPYAYDLAADLGERGGTVNVIAPGYVAETEFFRGKLSGERERTLIGQTHTGRACTPADVAATAHWLASPDAAQITAQIIQLNGGAERGR